MRGEEDLLRRIRSAFPPFRGGIGIGDDAAIVETAGPLAVTTDVLIEGVDFTRSIPVEFVAAKSLVANLSDLAAMGATPDAFFLTLGIPEQWLPLFDRFVSALAECAGRYRIALAGGDLSSSRDFTVSITAIGRFEGPAGPLLRSAAKPGHRLFVSRPLGGAAAGLRLLNLGWTIDRQGIAHEPEGRRPDYVQRELAGAVIRRQVSPEPEIPLGRDLRGIAGIGGCIDISDGFSTDLHRMCAASGAGAIVEWERLPSLPDLDRTGPQLGIDVPDCVLHGGEEYALLFTAAMQESQASRLLGRPVYAVGRITGEPGVLLEREGRSEPLEAKGYDHFSA